MRETQWRTMNMSPGRAEKGLVGGLQLQSLIHTGHLHSVMRTGESKARKQPWVT